MKDNAESLDEKEITKQQEKIIEKNLKAEQIQLEKNRLEEEQKLTDERMKSNKAIQERIKKESDQRRKIQNEKQERAKQLALDMVKKQKEQEMADRSIGAGKNVEQLLIRNRELDIQDIKRGTRVLYEGVVYERSEVPQKMKKTNTNIDKLRDFEKSAHEKVQEKLELHKDKQQEINRTR